MKFIKELIKQLTPPILISLYYRFKKNAGNTPFSGVYSKVEEIDEENPWVTSQWVELSRAKLNNVRELFSNSFMPNSDLGGYLVFPCLIINLLSQKETCHIIDFGGGTGFAFFKIYPYLLYSENVIYHVLDSNKELYNIGKQHARLMGKENACIFHQEMPRPEDVKFDVLFINTSLQYISDWPLLLAKLLRYNLQYVVLTRLIAGDMKTYLTCQNIYGYKTPCIFINFNEIVDFFAKNGFDLIFKAPCLEESFEGSYDKNIPIDLQIKHSANLIFKRKT